MSSNSIQRGNVILNNLDLLEEINVRIASRNIPSSNLPPCLSLRPTSTKYTTFMINRQFDNCLNTAPPKNFTVDSVFLPGDRQGPYSGFSNKINDSFNLLSE